LRSGQAASGGPPPNDRLVSAGAQAQGLWVSPAGDVYYAGNYNGQINLYPNDGTGKGTDGASSQLDSDKHPVPGAFLGKILADGTYAWSRHWEPPAGATFGMTSLSGDATGAVTLMGGFWGSLDYDPTPGLDWMLNKQINKDGNPAPATTFTRINADGSYGWTQRIDWPATVTVSTSDENGNVFAAGIFNNDADVDASPDEDWLTYYGAPDLGAELFVARLNADGSHAWTRRPLSYIPMTVPNAIAPIAGGDILVGGYFDHQVTFEWNTFARDYLDSAGGSDGFVLRAGADGSYRGTFAIGSTANDVVVGVSSGAGWLSTTAGVGAPSNLGGWAGGTPTSPAGSYVFIWPAAP
jgi:hypothetical protein